MLLGLLGYLIYIAIVYEMNRKKYAYYVHQVNAMRLLFRQLKYSIKRKINDSK